MKLVSVIAIAVVMGLASVNTAKAQWGGCRTPPVHRFHSVGYGPGWNTGFPTYRAGYYGVPGYYRSAGFHGYPRAHVAQRIVVPVYPVHRPVVVAPGWGPGWGSGFGPGWGGGFGPGWGGGFGPGWGGGFGPGWGGGFGPGWGGSGMSLRMGF